MWGRTSSVAIFLAIQAIFPSSEGSLREVVARLLRTNLLDPNVAHIYQVENPYIAQLGAKRPNSAQKIATCTTWHGEISTCTGLVWINFQLGTRFLNLHHLESKVEQLSNFDLMFMAI